MKPTSETELLARASAIAGRTLAELEPVERRRHKGWVGQLIERVLGADGGSVSGPDFAHLGIELKTIPVDAQGKPKESTWVCTARVERPDRGPWAQSVVRERLRRVLWVPILGDRVGVPILWSPDAEQERVLQEDWEAITEILVLGEIAQWRARQGKALQLRPKAANARDWVWVLDHEGEWVQTVPRGFYLRARFTASVVGGRPSG